MTNPNGDEKSANIATKYSFTVIGEEFSVNPADNRLILYSRDNNGNYDQVFQPSICWKNQDSNKCLGEMSSNSLNAIWNSRKQSRTKV